MTKLRPPSQTWLISILLLLISWSCAPTPTAPGPVGAAGVYIHTGFEHYVWEEGLRLMIWIEEIKSSSCNTTTNGQRFVMSCHAISHDDIHTAWHLTTSDGKTGDFSIDNQPYDLADGNLFLLAGSGGGMRVRQVRRDLSGVQPQASSVTEFGLADPAIQELIQVPAALDDGVSSSPVPAATPEAANAEAAREALRAFFSHLHAGEYGEATALYGGGYEIMQDHNPGIDPDDHAALFRNACMVNGAQCLQIRQAELVDQPSAAKFLFAVQFINEDGSKFVQGPCCGEEDLERFPPLEEFLYTVRLDCAGKYHVLELPVYSP